MSTQDRTVLSRRHALNPDGLAAIAPAGTDDCYDRAPLDGDTVGLIIRLGGLFRVSVNEHVVPAPMTAAVVRHMLAHDEFTVTCDAPRCSQARRWLAAWAEPHQNDAAPLRLVEVAS